MKKLRVLLVDDEIIIREGFKRLFDWDAHDCEVVGEAADGMEALSRIDALDPDLVIMDINIPIMNGLKVIQLSRIKHPETAFIIVSGYDDFSYCREALRLQDHGLHPEARELRGVRRLHRPAEDLPLPAQPQPGERLRRGGAAHRGHHPLPSGGTWRRTSASASWRRSSTSAGSISASSSKVRSA